MTRSTKGKTTSRFERHAIAALRRAVEFLLEANALLLERRRKRGRGRS